MLTILFDLYYNKNLKSIFIFILVNNILIFNLFHQVIHYYKKKKKEDNILRNKNFYFEIISRY